jgi:hypothetical protein
VRSGKVWGERERKVKEMRNILSTFRKVFALQCKKKNTSGNTLRFLKPTGVRGWGKHSNTNGNIVRFIDENRG